MVLAHYSPSASAKGWYNELDFPTLPAIGFATQGVNEPHYHEQLCEVYLVARGSSTMMVDGQPVALHAGDVIVVEPGEVHTFVDSTPDYFHFVLHCPRTPGDKIVVQGG